MEYDIETKERYLENVTNVNNRLFNYLSKLKMDIQQDIDDYNLLLDSIQKGKVDIYKLCKWSDPVMDDIPNVDGQV